MYRPITIVCTGELSVSWWEQNGMALYRIWLQRLSIHLYCCRMAAREEGRRFTGGFPPKYERTFLFRGYCWSSARLAVYRGALYRGWQYYFQAQMVLHFPRVLAEHRVITLSALAWCIREKWVWQTAAITEYKCGTTLRISPQVFVWLQQKPQS